MKKGKQIETLDDLVWAKADKKSVECPKFFAEGYSQAASSVLNLPGLTIVQLIKMGLFICEED